MAEILLKGQLAKRLAREAQQRGISPDQLVTHWLDATTAITAADEPLDPTKLYYNAVSQISIGVAVMDVRLPDTPIIYVNPAFERINGYRPGEVLGRAGGTIGQTFSPVEEIEKMALAMREGRSIIITATNFRSDGTPYWVEIHATPTYDEQGKQAYIVLLMNDVTPYVNFKDHALRSESIYNTSFELIGEGILLYDTKGKLITCNASAERMVGLTRQQLVEGNHTGSIQWEVFREDNTPCPKEEHPISLALQGKRQHNVVVGLRRPDYPMFWVSVNSEPICPPGETTPYAIICSFSDITAEHLAHQKIVESEARFRNMADHAPVLIWQSDVDGNCIYVNQTWVEFTGRTLEQESGKGWQTSIHPDDQKIYMEAYLDAFEKRTRFHIEYRLRHADGSYRWVVDTGVPRLLANGEFVGYIGTSSDVTDIKESQFALEKANLDLEKRVNQRTEQLRQVYQAALSEQMRMNELKTHFLSIVAHEFRNPLAVMKIATWFLHSPDAAKISVTQRTSKVIQIEKQIERLIQLIDDVTIAYKLQSTNFRVNLAMTNISKVVHNVVEDALQLDPGGLEIRFEMPDSLIVQTDELLLGHIVTNLLSNALKYSPDKKPITIGLEMNNGDVILSVRDQGIGIPPNDQAKLFELFHRGQNTGAIKGTGLGLAIVKYCVDALAGKITCRSEVGVGTTFTVSLPIERNPDQFIR